MIIDDNNFNIFSLQQILEYKFNLEASFVILYLFIILIGI
jgi:hypothetical protein